MQIQNTTGNTEADVSGQLEWNQVTETIKLLNVSIAQIILSLRVGDKSVDMVGDAFETLLSQVDKISSSAVRSDNSNDIKKLCDETAEQTRNFIFAFQFYDELSQRLNHVSHGLSGLSELIQDSGRFVLPQEWQTLNQSIREKYTIQNEIEMFDAVMSGMDIEQAVNRLVNEDSGEDPADNEVELF